jgi:hypothetical protein
MYWVGFGLHAEWERVVRHVLSLARPRPFFCSALRPCVNGTLWLLLSAGFHSQVRTSGDTLARMFVGVVSLRCGSVALPKRLLACQGCLVCVGPLLSSAPFEPRRFRRARDSSRAPSCCTEVLP